VGTNGHVNSGECATDAYGKRLKDNAVDSYRVENCPNTGQQPIISVN